MIYHNINIPYIVTAETDSDIRSWTMNNRAWLDTTLNHCGAVLLRGFRISNEAEFKALVGLFSSDKLTYLYRSTPRTSLGDGIYTATEYPSGLTIPQHSENSYQREWPMRLLFFCEYPATGGGGETPLSNNINVTNRIDPRVRERFMQKRIMYIRNYWGDFDLPWQTVFQTDSRAEVERVCLSKRIEYEWIGDDSLRTKQLCHAFARHPRTGALIWFNQAHLFHPSNLDAQARAAMLEMFTEDEFPRNVVYGDGSKIAEAELDDIREAFDRERTTFQWMAGDVLILDNMLIAHGRNPYKGQRRVLVGMCDRYSLEED
jgi:alpha-ketoglutarate-dependent taurine dioxygenase